MNEQEVKAQIDAVKAASFDQITNLNNQLQNAAQQVQQQNAVLTEVMKIVSPDNQNLTVEQLLATLKDAFITTTDGEGDD